MPYDKDSFLAGVAVGRNMKGWAFPVPAPAGTLGLSVKIDLDRYSGEFLVYCMIRTEYYGEPVDVYADWGDGTNQNYHFENPYSVIYQVNFRHAYSANGIYRVMIVGLFKAEELDNMAHNLNIVQFHAPLPCDYAGNFSDYQSFVTVPENLFQWFRNHGQGHLELRELFQDNAYLESVPETLFNGITLNDRPNIGSMFSGCRSLKEIGDGFFSNPGFRTTLYWQYIFSQCRALQEIPEGLFKQAIMADSFYACFEGCWSLTEIPAGLFSQAKRATNFSYCFSDCYSLTSIPEDLFDETSADNFTACFFGCTGITGAVPKLWEKFPNANGSYCFSRCTNASNYNEIPASWGGPSANQ